MNLRLWIISFVPVPKNTFPPTPAFTQCQSTNQKPYDYHLIYHKNKQAKKNNHFSLVLGIKHYNFA